MGTRYVFSESRWNRPYMEKIVGIDRVSGHDLTWSTYKRFVAYATGLTSKSRASMWLLEDEFGWELRVRDKAANESAHKAEAEPA